MTTSHGKVIRLGSWDQRLGLKVSKIIVWSLVLSFCAVCWFGVIALMRRLGV